MGTLDPQRRRLVAGPPKVAYACLAGFGVVLLRLALYPLTDQVGIGPGNTGLHEKRPVPVPARRGVIYDRNGQELAINTIGQSVFLHPRLLRMPATSAKRLADVLGLDPKAVLRMARSRKDFVYVKRLIPPEKVQAIQAIIKQDPGVGLLPEPQRLYPHHNLLASVLGFTGLENRPLAGLELSQNGLLKGTDGLIMGEVDAYGKPIPTRSYVVREVRHGTDIYLTIDLRIQELCERELAEAVSLHHARGGTVTVLDPRTGDVLAAVTQPGFDPNDYASYPKETYTTTIASITYEPGSTLKGIVVAAALDAGRVAPDDRFYCGGSKTLYDHTIRCPHLRSGGHGSQTPGDIVRVSCNVGALQIGARLGNELMLRYFKDFGFLGPTHIGIREETGSVPDYRGPVWSATASYGQGISVTPLQLASAYGAIANGGVLMRPRLIAKYAGAGQGRFKHTQPVEIHRVVSPEVAQRVMGYLTDVVYKEGGTGSAARPKGYRVAGKTGTAQVAGPGGFIPGQYVVSFVGMLPADAPQYVILVTVDRPDPSVAYGGTVAAPAFRDIAEGIATMKGMPVTAAR